MNCGNEYDPIEEGDADWCGDCCEEQYQNDIRCAYH